MKNADNERVSQRSAVFRAKMERMAGTGVSAGPDCF